MARILDILKQNHFTCLPSERFTLDVEMFPDPTESDRNPAQAKFEHPPLAGDKQLVRELPCEISPDQSIFRYFLDGSRRSYKVFDVVTDNKRYLPVIAGQVGVAVLTREGPDGQPRILRDHSRIENVIAFPESIPDENIRALSEKINESSQAQFRLVRYAIKPDKIPADLGLAKIIAEMQEMEIDTVRQMARQGLLGNDRVIVKDGSLQYTKDKIRDVLAQFRNVVGISKTFQPSFTIGEGKGKKDVGDIVWRLEQGERSCVFRPGDEGEATIGMWYLRIRPRDLMSNPLQGTVKIECFAVSQEEWTMGFSPDRVDTVSAYVLRERNVTPYRADSRWASHLYPVYLAEKYLKSSFLSDIHFKALFF